ncbi:MAG: glycosyltransferase family 2 protein [Burkholderiales bacterium]
MPKVSIVITAYNSEKYIEESIKSAIGQTEVDIEVIVVDDGSVDGTIKLAQDLSKHDERIKIHAQPHQGKPSITRNMGINLAKGEYLCFLDADDRYDIDKVRCQLNMLEVNQTLVGVFHDMKYMSENGEPISGSYLQDVDFLYKARDYLTKADDKKYICSNDFYKFMSLNFAAIHTSTIMLRRSLIESENIRFPEDVTVGEDTQVWWNLAMHGQIGYIDQILSHYRQHDSSVTKNKIQYFTDLTTIHIRNYERGRNLFDVQEKKRYRKRIMEHYSSLGYAYTFEFKYGEARQSYKYANRWFWTKTSTLAYLKTFFHQIKSWRFLF